MNRFDRQLRPHAKALFRDSLTVLQLNIGRKCNQACRHCHVAAAPWRTEMMNAKTARRIGDWIEKYRPPVVDITGGAPEMSEFFRGLVTLARKTGAHVIDRNNLTILEEPGYEDLPAFLASHKVEIIASLPCYSANNVNLQRGNGVFEKSIRALKKLNAEGYGSRATLNLVYNPLGAELPGPQAELEAAYKVALRREFGVEFNRLLTITNQPIARFADSLKKQGDWEEYMELLANHFNPATLPGLMCRHTLSVDYEGRLFDCDFNQMLGMRIRRNGRLLSLWDVTPESLDGQKISTGEHCLACTAGAGSSCGGALV